MLGIEVEQDDGNMKDNKISTYLSYVRPTVA